MKKSFLTCLYASLLAYILISCAEKAVGPATEEGNPVLAGTVVTPAAKAAENATIQVYRPPVIFDSAFYVPRVEPVAVTTTGEDGYFAFFELAPGLYVIECIDPGNNAYAISGTIKILTDSGRGDSAVPVVLDTITVTKPGAIQGTVTRDGVLGGQSNMGLDDGFIQVMLLEINREDLSRQDGSFELGRVPEGIYTLAFKADDFFTAYKDSVKVESGKTTTVDKVTLERIPWMPPPKPGNLTADYDTANALVYLKWSPAKAGDLLGYQVERRENPLVTGLVFTAMDTVYSDTVSSVSSGTTLYYVVRAINERFMASANEGPVEIKVK